MDQIHYLLSMSVRSLAAMLLDAAAKSIESIEAIPVPEGLKDAGIFADPKGPQLFAQLVERSSGRLSQTDYEFLGRGTRGAAYASGNVVLKITNDESEAEASSIIRDNPDPDGRASKIWDVFELRGRHSSAYAVIQERLEPLDYEDADWHKYADLWPAWTKQNEYEHMTTQTAKQFLRDCERAKLVDSTGETWLAFSIWFTGLAQYLAKNGVKYHDFWHRNLMKRGSTYVAIDFGYSRSEEPEEGFAIDVLAKFKAVAEMATADADVLDADQIALLRALKKAEKPLTIREVEKMREGQTPWFKQFLRKHQPQKSITLTPEMVRDDELRVQEDIHETVRKLVKTATVQETTWEGDQRLFPDKANNVWCLTLDPDQAFEILKHFGPATKNFLDGYAEKARMSGHPYIDDAITIAWVRYYDIDGVIWIDEIQTDLRWVLGMRHINQQDYAEFMRMSGGNPYDKDANMHMRDVILDRANELDDEIDNLEWHAFKRFMQEKFSEAERIVLPTVEYKLKEYPADQFGDIVAPVSIYNEYPRKMRFSKRNASELGIDGAPEGQVWVMGMFGRARALAVLAAALELGADPSELDLGMREEFEHTDDPDIAQQIAMDHLREDPNYYKKLRECGLTQNSKEIDVLEAAAECLAGLSETNMVQFMLAQEMKKDFMDWVQEYGEKFRKIYNENTDVKTVIDQRKFSPTLLQRLIEMLNKS